ncbi:hypothetical protein SAMN05216388_100550 [Halorientalis persicus]|uniref:Rpa-associated protein n=1 Tax=Halorientalis persicus TaxID=1367881 RepID=A0A1H8JEH7_9EURY|nr:hypothetical protein [Halorientalis persicus]SEN78835.1 hypothetical protein SAMN05216388_100550 [Halorientalis persicus]
MSGSEDDADQGGAGRREVAYRIFAAEYDDADFSYSESDEERAPNYVVTPSGARVNRLFVVGVLTEVEQVNEDVLRARIVDPTGAFVAYAGQYQPDEMAFLDRAEPPTFVALTGKARTFQPDDADTVYTSVRPESINEVDAETRDRWTVATAERTLARIATMAGALSREERGDDLSDALIESGVDEGLAAGTALALEHYGTTPTYLDALRETALDAARVVSGDVDEVDALTVDPDDRGSVTVADLDGLEISAGGAAEPSEGDEPDAETATATAESGGTASTSDDSGSTETAESATSATDASEPEPVTGDAGTETPGVETDEEPVESVETEAETDTESVDAESESAESTESAPGSTDDDIGDFEPSGGAGADDEGVGDFDPGEFELDEDEREEIEEEYGTDFSTGTEVSEPGEADIETPDPEPDEGEPTAESEPVEPTGETATAPEDAESESAEEPADAATGTATESAEPAASTEPAESDDTDETAAEETTDEPAEDVDLEDAVMDAMNELDDGDGADRETLIEQVADRTGADPGAVADAVQDALMDGRCYEPDEATLKPI